MRDPSDNFAIVLKAIRQEHGLSQSELASLAGVPQPFISRLERSELDLATLTNSLRIIRTLRLPTELVDRVLGLTSPVLLAEQGLPLSQEHCDQPVTARR